MLVYARTYFSCNGGDNVMTFKKAALYGIASGGEIGSGVGCVPMTVGWEDKPANWSLPCASQCSNANWTIPINNDQTRHTSKL